MCRPSFITSSSNSSKRNRLRRSLVGLVFCGDQINPFLQSRVIQPCHPLCLVHDLCLPTLQGHRGGRTNSNVAKPARRSLLLSLSHKRSTERTIFRLFLWTDEQGSLILTSGFFFAVQSYNRCSLICVIIFLKIEILICFTALIWVYIRWCFEWHYIQNVFVIYKGKQTNNASFKTIKNL